MTGFIDGEGTFYVGIYAKDDMRTGYQVSLEFAITQHVRDLTLMNKLPLFFHCGYVAMNKGKSTCQYRMRNISHLENHLFPLLDAYPLQTQKSLDATAFREVHALIKDGKHLTLLSSRAAQRSRSNSSTKSSNEPSTKVSITSYACPLYGGVG